MRPVSTAGSLRCSELERLLEPIERRMYGDLYRALPESLARDCGIQWIEEGPFLRLTCRCLDHPFFNRVMGVRNPGRGFGRWLAEVVDHYEERGIGRWMLQVAPGDHTPALSNSLLEAGLAPLRGWAKHAATVDRMAAPSQGPSFDLRVESIGSAASHRGQALDWASIVVPAFGFPPASEDWPAATVGRPGWLHYLAYDGEQPVASAAMFVREGVGTLTFAATLESHRRRGAQSALIAARLRDARHLGLEWIVTETDEELPDKPNPSYHNIVRFGMPVRYVRSNWGPPPPMTAGGRGRQS